MTVFIAKNPKQLDICLKLLYAEHIAFKVNVQESNKGKIEYAIYAEVDEQKGRLQEKYRILIS